MFNTEAYNFIQRDIGQSHSLDPFNWSKRIKVLLVLINHRFNKENLDYNYLTTNYYYYFFYLFMDEIQQKSYIHLVT